ncbi:MAG: hypothetical protein KJ063_10335 [Anaerolineae bacterium]|nr:hypothetical protein [Anaerolineae bacterium]
MSVSVIIHINNEDAMVGEIDKLPDVRDTIVVVHNPRRRDGKDVHYLDDDVSTLIVPWHRINFIQVLPSGSVEEVIGFVRD